MKWKFVDLDVDEISFKTDGHMMAEIFAEFYFSEFPPGAAVYRVDIAGGGKRFYFNPGAIKIAGLVIDSYFSTECRKPDLTTLEQIIGIKK